MIASDLFMNKMINIYFLQRYCNVVFFSANEAPSSTVSTNDKTLVIKESNNENTGR